MVMVSEDLSRRATVSGEDVAMIVVIVTGSIAAPSSAGLVAEMKATGTDEVAVVMTRTAQRFVGRDVLQFTGGADAVLTDDSPQNGRFPNHVSLAKHANRLIVYPASAHFIGRVANGIANDLASTVALCSISATRIIFPSVNSEMWSSPIVQRNVDYMRVSGFDIYPTENGLMPLPDVAMAYMRGLP